MADSSPRRKSSKVPALIRQLHFVLCEEAPLEFRRAIRWANDNQFIICDVDTFKRQILDKVFNYAEYSSFMRQLYKYSFRKLRGTELIFTHDTFRKGLTLAELSELRGIRFKQKAKFVHPKYKVGDQTYLRWLRSKPACRLSCGLKAQVGPCQADLAQVSRQLPTSQSISCQISFFLQRTQQPGIKQQ